MAYLRVNDDGGDDIIQRKFRPVTGRSVHDEKQLETEQGYQHKRGFNGASGNIHKVLFLIFF